MSRFDIYLAGVGGQGVGMLSEILLHAADHAGLAVKAVDTHGLAQRGGIVVSQIRLGAAAHSPLIMAHTADLAVALERHEALRAVQAALKDAGTLIYYDTAWQPLDVRLGRAAAVTAEDIAAACERRRIRVVPVASPALEDVRMQNIVVLAHIDRLKLVPGVATAHYQQAMDDLMAGSLLQRNRELFDLQRQEAA